MNAGILENIQTFFINIITYIKCLSVLRMIIVSYSRWIVCIILLIPIIRYWFEKSIIYLNMTSLRKYGARGSIVSILLNDKCREYFKEIKMFRLFDFLIKILETLEQIAIHV